jgi:pyruvate/2-oxoglutarate dehydrogenase complex dihydrolipoamide acyltransferase (E2) component
LTDRVGRYTVRKLTASQLSQRDALDAIGAGYTMTALLEFDVTEARRGLRRLKGEGSQVSFFAFVVQAVGKALARTPELNAMVSGNRIYRFEDIDVAVPVEVELGDGRRIPRQVVLRNVDRKSLVDLTHEVALGKTGGLGPDPTGRTGMDGLLWVPRWLRVLILRFVVSQPLAVKAWSGTVFLTSVTGFTSVPGFVIPTSGGPKAVSFAVGSVRKADGKDLLSMSVLFNHIAIDGAPAARFIEGLRRILDTGPETSVLH